jgi:3-oxoadipate enol-lactonase
MNDAAPFAGLMRTAGLGLWIEQSGRGDPVLLISGLGYSNWCWADLQARLSGSYRVISFDNRGTGRSDKPAAPYSIAMMATDAQQVLDALGIEGAHVVGHSMGGYIAQQLALQAADRVMSLTLISTTCGGPEAVPVPESTLALWGETSKLPPQESARRAMPTSFAPGWTEKNPERFEEVLAARLLHPTPQQFWGAQFAAAAAFIERGADVAQIRCPTLIVHGTEDRIVPYGNGELLSRRIPGAKLETLQGCGHLPLLEEPERLARLLAEHLVRAAAAS